MADSKIIETGGSAFPNPAFANEGYHGSNDEYGMTLRDWFAGKALAESTREIWSSHKYDDVAKRAYAIADAMIVARKAGA
ncbi:hypothetical protein [Rhizobium rhizogenes]|uniref:hypothetical protein n=1 Tax=Rhizobium rhizogenes TaxID=359 RepID=UPI001573BCE0|nr:hypothetical protein [Rhizobium rhizogenes]NTG07202.1 hypothetical protein [Rhizobium rhizogenes]